MIVTQKAWPVRTWLGPSCVSALLACSADQMETDAWVSKTASAREIGHSFILQYSFDCICTLLHSSHPAIFCSVLRQTWMNVVPNPASVKTAAVSTQWEATAASAMMALSRAPLELNVLVRLLPMKKPAFWLWTHPKNPRNPKSLRNPFTCLPLTLSYRQQKGLLLHRGSADHVPAVINQQEQCDQVRVLL